MIITIGILIVLALNKVVSAKYLKIMMESLIFVYAFVTCSSLVTLNIFHMLRYEEADYVVMIALVYGLLCIAISLMFFDENDIKILSDSEKLALIKKIKFLFGFFSIFPAVGFTSYLFKLVTFIAALTSLIVAIDACCLIFFLFDQKDFSDNKKFYPCLCIHIIIQIFVAILQF